MSDRQFWMQERQALLMRVANIEALLELEPRTAERCKAAKALERGDADGVREYVAQYGRQPERS